MIPSIIILLFLQAKSFIFAWGLPECELLKLIIRYNIGPISAANSRLLLLGQCHRLHRSSPGPTTAAFVDCLNLPTFSQSMAQYRPYSKPIVTLIMASGSESRRARVQLMDGTFWQTILERHDIGNRFLATFLPMLGQCWAVCNFALG